MAVLSRVRFSSAERLDLPDIIADQSYNAADWRYFIKSIVGDVPYVLKGFEVVDPQLAVGSSSLSISPANSVLYHPTSNAGCFYYGLDEASPLSQPLVPSLKKNATNYVYLSLTTINTANDTRAMWDPDIDGGNGGEFTQDIDTATTISVSAAVSIASFPTASIPICKVVVGANFIESIEDCRNLMFRLGSGGIAPAPQNRYNFRSLPNAAYKRSEPSTIMQTALDPNSFRGGDKNIYNLKEWMDAIMTKIAELGGTQYWYEDLSTFNMLSLYEDALASTVHSKGRWKHDSGTPGELTWTEDLIYSSIQDKRDYLIRANTIQLANDEIAYIQLNRNFNFNAFNLSVDWFNGASYVNGPVGAFTDLAKGDWIKKYGENNINFVRIEQFYAGPNLSGGATVASSAQSVKLNIAYAGTTENKFGTACQGIYVTSDVVVESRASTNVPNIGGNLYWLAYRSDIIHNVSSIVGTTLSLDITEHDGTTAKCTIVGGGVHGLSDTQSIGIAGSANFDGIYTIEKEDDYIFYITNTTGTYADEFAVTARYATATCITRYNADGTIQLESANHNLKTGDSIIIAGASIGWNATHSVYVDSAWTNTFTIPVMSAIADYTYVSGPNATCTLPSVFVRTEFGPLKLQQGENKSAGVSNTTNIMSFIGMVDVADLKPLYTFTQEAATARHTLYGFENYGAASMLDDLTQRVARLTAMMADKAQDKEIKFAPQYEVATMVTNGANQEITFAGATPLLNIIMPGVNANGTVTLSGTLSLPINSVAYLRINRNASFSLANLSALTISSIKTAPIEENVFIFAYRKSGTSVWLWDGVELINGNNLTPGIVSTILGSNAYDENIEVIAGVPSTPREIQGPVVSGTAISLPPDSRDGNNAQYYVVGQGVLEVYLNGQYLDEGHGWSEVGAPGTLSSQIQINIGLVVGDSLGFRIDTAGGYVSVGGGGGSGDITNGQNDPGGVGQGVFKQKLGAILEFKTISSGPGVTVTSDASNVYISSSAGGGLSVATKTSNYNVQLSDDVILVNAASGNVTLVLPQLSTVTSVKQFVFKKIDSSLNSMILDGFGLETIDGATTQTTNVQWEAFTLIPTPTGWMII